MGCLSYYIGFDKQGIPEGLPKHQAQATRRMLSASFVTRLHAGCGKRADFNSEFMLFLFLSASKEMIPDTCRVAIATFDYECSRGDVTSTRGDCLRVIVPKTNEAWTRVQVVREFVVVGLKTTSQ